MKSKMCMEIWQMPQVAYLLSLHCWQNITAAQKWQEFYPFRHPLHLMVVMTLFWTEHRQLKIENLRRLLKFLGGFALLIQVCLSFAIYFLTGKQKWWMANTRSHTLWPCEKDEAMLWINFTDLSHVWEKIKS